ncbi:CHAP domain-containing protein [Nonomuraea dietziae]|uniref:CHAP domain-containing protein n=1 Tax=Nonomuraea dietziae TaxID=65515 RepID=UPI003444F4F4
MAKHRRSRAPKMTYAHAALGAAVLAGSLVPTQAAQADIAPAPQDKPRVAAMADAPAPQDKSRVAAMAAKTDGKQAAVKQQQRVPAMPTASAVLAEAKKQIGVKENSSGGGTKFQQWYVNSQRARETVARDGGSPRAYANAAWCAMFVSWVGEMTGARPQVGWDAYTVAHAKWFKSNERWGTTPKPGAVVFFSWSGSKNISSINHVGFVEKDNGNGTITTVEGNTGNGAVEQRVRPKSQVVGYGYPQYSGA